MPLQSEITAEFFSCKIQPISAYISPSQIGLENTNQIPKMKKDVHVVPHGNEWAIKRPGNERASSLHPTQADAIERGRTVSREAGSELFIHRPDGTIRDRDSHGKDKFPPRG
jgi:hypothetical protein